MSTQNTAAVAADSNSLYGSSVELSELVYTAIFEKNMRNSTVNYLIPDWLTAVT